MSIAHLYSPEGEADDEMGPGFLPIGEDEGTNLWPRPELDVGCA